MPKYVCDYDVVAAVAQQIIQSASDLNAATATYSGRFESDLSGWNSTAKNNLATQYNGQIDKIKEKTQYMNNFGEFLLGATNSIQDLDNQLASIDI